MYLWTPFELPEDTNTKEVINCFRPRYKKIALPLQLQKEKKHPKNSSRQNNPPSYQNAIENTSIKTKEKNINTVALMLFGYQKKAFRNTIIFQVSRCKKISIAPALQNSVFSVKWPDYKHTIFSLLNKENTEKQSEFPKQFFFNVDIGEAAIA